MTRQATELPNLINDSFLPSLTQRLEKLDRAGFDTTNLVQSAAAKTPLPDDHPAAALWWRILDEIAPTTARQFTSNNARRRTPERYETTTRATSSTPNGVFNDPLEPLNPP